MNRPAEMVRVANTAIREGVSAIRRQSERTLMLGTILILSAVSAAMLIVLSKYYWFDVSTSLLFPELDTDYDWSIYHGMTANPWEHDPLYPGDENDYVAAGLVPQVFFELFGRWLHAPRLGSVAYLFVLTIAVLSPALWAARGTRGRARVAVIVACGAAALPAWAAIYRANSVGFLAPLGLMFLLALSRRRWGMVAITVVLAALVKPHFVALVVVLFSVRQWRLGGITVAAALLSNLAAYLVWPRDFPGTVVRSIVNALHHDSKTGVGELLWNVSFAKGFLLIPDSFAASNAGGKVPEGFLAGPRAYIGYVVLAVIVVCLMALGRRIPPVMAGMVLLAAAALSTATSFHYYLVFALPIAALVVRDADGPPGFGLFDRLGAQRDRRRAVGVCVSLAAALSIARLPLPGPLIRDCSQSWLYCLTFVPTTVLLTPLLWLIACTVIIVSYARRPASVPEGRPEQAPNSGIEYRTRTAQQLD